MAGSLSTIAGSLSERKTTHVVAFGYPTAERTKYGIEPLHDQKVKMFVKLLKEISDFEIHTPKFEKTRDFHEFLDDFLKGLDKSDIKIFYNAGATRDSEQRWEMRLENGPKGWIDGQKFLQYCYDSGHNVAIFLDGNIPTRFEKPCVPRSDGRGNTEIMARGSIASNAKGNAMEGHSSDFTINMIGSLDDWVEEIKAGTYKGKVPMSIAQIMGTNRNLRYNPVRIFDRQPRARGRKTPIDRLVIDPEDVRESGKLCFRMKRVQDGDAADASTETVDADATKAESIPEDEGYDDAEDEAVERPVNDPTNGDSLFCTPAPE